MPNSTNHHIQREEPAFVEFIEHSIARILFQILIQIFRFTIRHSTANRETRNNLNLEHYRRQFASDLEAEESETNLE